MAAALGGGSHTRLFSSAGEPLTIHVPEADADRAAEVYSRIGATALSSVSAVGTAAIEAVVGRVAGAFACAEVLGSASRVLTPTILEHIGRQLMQAGESIHWIASSMRGLQLVPCYEVDVYGDPEPQAWQYILDIQGPSNARQVNTIAGRVLHVRRGESADEPWEGRPPLSRAGLTTILSTALERSLGREAQMPVKQIITLPDSIAQPDADAVKGRLMDGTLLQTPRTSQADFGGDGGGRPQRDWDPRRLGPDPTDAEVKLASEVTARVATAMGVHPALIVAGDNGSVDREAVRQFREMLLEPLACRIEQEVQDKIGSCRLRWPISDHSLLIRTRAYQQAVDAGFAPDEAVRIARLEVEPGAVPKPPEPEPAPELELQR